MRRLFALILLAGLAQTASAATLIMNVRGWTPVGAAGPGIMDARRFEAMVVADDGRVVMVGDEAAARAAAAEIDEPLRIHNGAGRFLMPGLIDAHGHFTSLGYDRMRLDITGLRSLGATLDAIRAYADADEGEGWILGGRWNQEHWPEARFPTADDLEGITDRPIWLRRVDGHAAWANRAALEAAGVDRDTPDPPGGQIIRDEDGEPTGVMVDAAEGLIDDIVPEPTEADVRRAVRAAQRKMFEVGLTSVHDAGASPQEIAIFQRMAASGELKARLYVMLAGERALDQYPGPVDDPMDIVDVKAVKLYADGALGSRGAALFEDYSDDEGNTGLLFIEAPDLARIIDKANAKGFQVGVHAIGTRANNVVLDAYEQAIADDPAARDRRHRIEHAQVIPVADLRRMARLGVVASMQPTHATSDAFMAEKRLGPDRLDGAYAWRTLIASGTHMALGSDFPVEPPEPMYGLHAAVTRQTRDDEPPGGWRIQEGISLTEALRGFTLDAAWAAHQEDSLGSLEPGKWADFVLLEQDPFTVDPMALWRIEVAETWVAGERVFARDED